VNQKSLEKIEELLLLRLIEVIEQPFEVFVVEIESFKAFHYLWNVNHVLAHIAFRLRLFENGYVLIDKFPVID